MYFYKMVQNLSKVWTFPEHLTTLWFWHEDERGVGESQRDEKGFKLEFPLFHYCINN